MCGLIHVKRFNGSRAAKMVVKRYRQQELRGKEGFGFVSFNRGKQERYIRGETDAPILKEMLSKKEDEIMFHHRRPTSTPNYWQTAHPILVSHEMLLHDYFVIHNGTVYDTDKLKAVHDKEGFKYSTLLKQYWLSADKEARAGEEKWNDSESFAIELAKDLDGKQAGLPDLRGSIAFIAVQMEKKNGQAINLFWGRNFASPLMFDRTKDYMVITSAGSGKEVEAHELNTFDYKTKEVKKKGYKIGITAYSGTGYNYQPPNPSDVKQRMGFAPAIPSQPIPKQELIAPARLNPEEVEVLLDEWEEYERNKKELDDIEGDFGRGMHGSDEVYEWYMERAADLKEAIKAYDEKYVKLP